jgi:low temperature requirement protein LtrA
VLGLLLSACLWWAYFGGDDEAAELALTRAPLAERAWLSLVAFGVWHMPILLGIIATAAGLKEATGHPFDHLHGPEALALAGGVALFMAGDALFRRTLAIGTGAVRAATGIAALATIPLGLEVSAAAQIAALVVLLAGALTGERARARTEPGLDWRTRRSTRA